jgi:hypothetical protein
MPELTVLPRAASQVHPGPLLLLAEATSLTPCCIAGSSWPIAVAC